MAAIGSSLLDIGSSKPSIARRVEGNVSGDSNFMFEEINQMDGGKFMLPAVENVSIVYFV